MNELIWRTVLHSVLAFLLSCSTVLAEGGGGGGSGDRWGNSKLRPVQEAIDKGDYEAALHELDALHQENARDADVLNLLGYSYRQLGDFDKALAFYQAALREEPRHRGVNEYLGELYLQTGQLGKAEERLAVLDKVCFFGCKEFYDLEEAIAAYKQKNGAN